MGKRNDAYGNTKQEDRCTPLPSATSLWLRSAGDIQWPSLQNLPLTPANSSLKAPDVLTDACLNQCNCVLPSGAMAQIPQLGASLLGPKSRNQFQEIEENHVLFLLALWPVPLDPPQNGLAQGQCQLG